MEQKPKIPKYLTKAYPILIVLATLIMGIGYASSTMTLNVTGTMIANAQKELTITSISCSDLENTESVINNYNKTILDSKITLSPTDISSTVTCSVTVKNNTNNNYAFKEIVYGNEFYDNQDIIVETNMEKKEQLTKNTTKTFDITFKYKDNLEEITNNILNSVLNIKFQKYYTITYENITNNDYPTIAFEGENLDLTFIDDIPNDILVTGNNNYSYIIPNLTISNITDNIIIKNVMSGVISNKHYDQLVFDGTKDSVIDTGLYLYNAENVNKNFRISFTIDSYDPSFDNASNIKQQTIFNCKNEAVSSVWPGIMLRLAKNGTIPKYEFGIRDSHITTTYKSYNIASGIKVSVIRENGKIYVNWNSKKHTVAYTYSDSIDTFDVPLTFGGIINSAGEYDRIFKGTLSDINVDIYEGDLVEEIDTPQAIYVETKEENLYRLDGMIYFDGTNYIDTGINLFSSENGDKDFDISFTLEELKTNNAQATLVNAKNEADSTYPGFAYRYESGKMSMTARWPGQSNVSQPDASTTYPKNVNISRRDGIIYYKIRNGEETTLIATSMESLTKTFDVNLTFGASIDSSGNPFRYFKGYVSDIKVEVYDN